MPGGGVVDQDVDVAEARDRGWRRAFDLREVRDVGLLIDHGDAGTARERVAAAAPSGSGTMPLSTMLHPAAASACAIAKPSRRSIR